MPEHMAMTLMLPMHWLVEHVFEQTLVEMVDVGPPATMGTMALVAWTVHGDLYNIHASKIEG